MTIPWCWYWVFVICNERFPLAGNFLATWWTLDYALSVEKKVLELVGFGYPLWSNSTTLLEAWKSEKVVMLSFFTSLSRFGPHSRERWDLGSFGLVIYSCTQEQGKPWWRKACDCWGNSSSTLGYLWSPLLYSIWLWGMVVFFAIVSTLI